MNPTPIGIVVERSNLIFKVSFAADCLLYHSNYFQTFKLIVTNYFVVN
nr:MAG TPA: hypothetical protein [Caudoviricetes sp.]